MARRHRVVDHIVGYLAASGVDYIFGVDGANIEDLYDAAFFRDDITAVLAKHEFSAATMADGYSRSGAGLGVVAATSGGGCLNTVPGLGEAFASRVPVLALIGQPPTTLDGRGAFQDTSGRNGALDAEALFSAVSVYCRRVVRPADIITALPEAIAAARTGGPAVLLLPKDIQQSDVGLNGRGFEPNATQLGDPGAIANALRRADGPITIIAGEQVARDDARVELEQLRAMLRARIATVPDAKDVAGTPGLGSSSALGVTGVMGHPGVAGGHCRQRVVPAGGHSHERDVACRAGRRAGVGSRGVDRIGVAIRGMRARAHRRPARLAVAVDRGPDAERQAAQRAGARRGAAHRAAAAAVQWSGDPLPRCHDGAGRGAAGRDRRRRRRGKHRRVGDSLPAGEARRHGSSSLSAWAVWVQLWSRRRRGVRASERPRQGRPAEAANGRHRRRRLLPHARHGDPHRAAVPAAGDRSCSSTTMRTRCA